jgi:uncharacterized protein YqhQ
MGDSPHRVILLTTINVVHRELLEIKSKKAGKEGVKVISYYGYEAPKV